MGKRKSREGDLSEKTKLVKRNGVRKGREVRIKKLKKVGGMGVRRRDKPGEREGK